MAVRLRLTRKGKKKQPTYRIVAADQRAPRDGRFIEIVGFYDPRAEPSVVRVDNDKAVKWLKHGAQPSERVKKLLMISGAWQEFTGEDIQVTVPPPKVKRKVAAKAKAPSGEADGSAEASDESAAEEPAAEPAEATADAPAEASAEPAAEEPAAEEPAEEPDA